MVKTVVLTRDAAKALDRMPNNVRALIRSKLELLAADPRALANNVKALKGSDVRRLRVGDWRVVFTSEPEHIVVHDIGPRGSIYD